MSQVYIPLISALVGAFIGGAASVVTVWIQAKTSDRRERLRHASELALADYRINLELSEKAGRRYSAPPVVLFLHYHLGLMDLMESGKMDEKGIRALAEENRRFMAAIKDLNEEDKQSK